MIKPQILLKIQLRSHEVRGAPDQARLSFPACFLSSVFLPLGAQSLSDAAPPQPGSSWDPDQGEEGRGAGRKTLPWRLPSLSPPGASLSSPWPCPSPPPRLAGLRLPGGHRCGSEPSREMLAGVWLCLPATCMAPRAALFLARSRAPTSLGNTQFSHLVLPGAV